MNTASLLYRQVHPNNMDGDTPTSVAFRPTDADMGKLSVHSSELITAEGSHTHWTQELKKASAGVWGVTVSEVLVAGLSAVPDPLENNPAHALIDFNPYTNKSELRRKAKELLEAALKRGCLHPGAADV